MNERLITRKTRAQWRIYESSDRWIRAVRRFASEFEPENDCMAILPMGPISSDFDQMIHKASVDLASRGVVLWQIDATNIRSAVSAIMLYRARYDMPSQKPNDLHIAAASDLSATSLMALSELGVATIIRRPEQLPSLRKMIRAHWAARSNAVASASRD